MRLIDIVFSEDYDRLEDFIRQANERYLSQNS
jgi:hypothetical protein